MTSGHPLQNVTERLARSANGRRGIRNPFVIVPVQPKYERRVAAEFEGVDVGGLYDLFEMAWNGDAFTDADLVDPAVVQQAERYAAARRLVESAAGGASRWSQLRQASRRLEEERPNPGDERMGELIEEAERLLESGDDQLRRIREAIAGLEEDSVVVVETADRS